MCRFILVHSKDKIKPQNLMNNFSDMAKKSKALDGDWQGDGCGIAWINEEGNWSIRKSLLPIWEDRKLFNDIDLTHTFIAHARSASFMEHKGFIEFNEPYINKKFAFVFNGILKGVSLHNIPGKIGAQKIWYLLEKELEQNDPNKALEIIKELLLKNSKEIVALNMGLATEENIYSLCYFSRNPEYYKLWNYKSKNLEVICSEEIPIV
ncbi:MAG: class II glutamine amidotransferase [Patescibacteria group bacterium]